MSVFIFYGQDNISLDNYYLEFRKNYTVTEIVQTNTANLEDKVGSQGFFAEKKLFIVNNIFAKQIRLGKVSNTLDMWLKNWQKYSQNYDWMFIEEDSKKIKYYKKYFPKGSYKEFKIAAYLFNFLDEFRPKNLKRCYSYFQKSLLASPPELILFMLKARVRDLISLSTNNAPSRFQSWQLSKLKSQLASWPPPKLDSVYKALFNYDKGLKSGNNPSTAGEAIETILTVYL